MLHAGPASTLDIARDVLRLEGHAGAASKAVFALLGEDQRFRVDERGTWSLRDRTQPPGIPLSRLRYAVVDVETTGGRYESGHRITEVAVVDVRGGAVTDSFHTLVHPNRRILSMTARLTGITDDMVADAPTFDEIADEVYRRINGKVFVAHNASFDWGWVSAQLGDAIGDVPDVTRLCTVNLARRLVPELHYRNLDSLTEHFEIPIHARHRAHGDALATARVLLRLLDRAENLGIGDLRSLQRYRPRKAHQGQGNLFAAAGVPRRSRGLV